MNHIIQEDPLKGSKCSESALSNTIRTDHVGLLSMKYRMLLKSWQLYLTYLVGSR